MYEVATLADSQTLKRTVTLHCSSSDGIFGAEEHNNFWNITAGSRCDAYPPGSRRKLWGFKDLCGINCSICFHVLWEG